MNAREMTIEQIDAKLESLTLAGQAMRAGQLINEDEQLVENVHGYDGETWTGRRYALTLALEIAENDEGLQVVFTLGGPYVAAQHIADFDHWYMLGRSSTFRRDKVLNTEEHADALAALNSIIAP